MYALLWHRARSGRHALAFLVATGGAVVTGSKDTASGDLPSPFIICMAYPLELALQKTIWWDLNHTVMAAFGFVAGVGLGGLHYACVSWG